MADYVEFQDLKVRVQTGDAAIVNYTERTIHSIDPEGNAVDFEHAVVTVADTSKLAADIPPASLIGGWWRFAASARDTGGKLRKTPWYRLYIKAEGEV